MVKKERYESTIHALYKRNEKYFALSALIFFGSMFLGYFHLFDAIMAPLQQQFKKSVIEGEIQLTTLSLFANNLKIMLYIYGGGIALGLITVGLLFINGAFIGYFATQVPLGDFILLTLPHGILEIISLIIAGGAGFRLAHFVYKFIDGLVNETWYGSFVEKIKHVFNEYSDEITESLMLMAIAIVLLFIAAIIEANFTIAWYQYVKGSI